MYYLFIRRKEELEKYKNEFSRVLEAIEKGKTPVYNELRNANTVLFESIPYQTLMKIAVVLVVNNMCYALANFIFAYAKHYLRIRLCKRLGIEPTERFIAVMESMEYQSV